MSYPDVRFAGGPTYQGTFAGNPTPVLFPFSFNNGTLDLPAGFTGGQNGTATPYTQPGNGGTFIRRLGGDSVVSALGTNLKNYIKNTPWHDGTTAYTVTGSINIVAGGQVTKVQQLGPQNLPANVEAASFRVSTSQPMNFVQYGSSYLFDAPLIISATTTTAPIIYITFYTQWDH